MKNDYTLDFVIPSGPTGPTGPAGLPSLCFVKFADITSSGNMTIDETKIFPNGTSDYVVTSDTVTIQESGNYEVTFCGKIDTNSANTVVEVKLMGEMSGTTMELPGMSGKWKDGTQMIHFSQTSVYQFQSTMVFHVVVTLAASTNFQVSAINLIIKKLPF